jgi:hypothetical protein
MPQDGSTVHLSAEIASAVDGAAAMGNPIAVAYVDGASRPHLSLRGTVHVYGDDQLAFWARSRGLPDGVNLNPNIALLYQDLAHRTFYVFNGRARVVTDQAVRDLVFDNTSEREQAQDPERAGSAVIVEVDSVQGRGPDGPVDMVRPADVSIASQPAS